MPNYLYLATAVLAATHSGTKHLAARQAGNATGIPACDTAVSEYYNAQWTACKLPKVMSTNASHVKDMLRVQVEQLCTNPSCAKAYTPFESRITSSCPTTYTATVQSPLDPRQTISLPMSDFYPSVANASQFDPATSVVCKKDPSGKNFCYAELIGNLLEAAFAGGLNGVGAKDVSGKICNSCTWVVVDGLEKEGEGAMPQVGLSMNNGQDVGELKKTVEGICGAGWFANNTNGEVPYTTGSNSSTSGTSADAVTQSGAMRTATSLLSMTVMLAAGVMVGL